MDIGKLRHKIEIQEFSDFENEIGEITKDWTTYKKVWASKERLRSTTSYVDNKEVINDMYRFKIRYREDITEKMRVVYKGIAYDITHVNNIDELNQYETHIDCTQHKEDVYNE